jgi:hypothetical protein
MPPAEDELVVLDRGEPMTLLMIAGYAAFVALLTVAIDWLAPRWSRVMLVLAASLPVPVLVAAAAIYFVASIGPAQPGEIDAGAMAMMAFMFIGAFAVVVAFPVGLLVSFLVARWLRAP